MGSRYVAGFTPRAFVYDDNLEMHEERRSIQKKSGKGCLIAVAVAGGIAVLLGIAAGIFMYKFATSKEGRAVISIVGEGTDIAKESLTAPGTKELRDMGCATAAVLDMERMTKLVTRFVDAGRSNASKLPFRMMVTCQPGSFSNTSPACDDVARTYVTAVGRAPGRFCAQVMRQGGNNKPVCRKLYAADGTPLGDLHGAGGSAPVESAEE